MVFWSSFAKKIKQSVSQISFDALKNRVNNIENKYVKKDESNTLTQTNTFTNQTNFKSRIEFRNPNNNGAYLDNFDFGSQNYTSFKLVKGSTNMLQIEVNNDANTATISSPNTNNGLHIYNLSNPVNADNATNKGYVDGLYNPLNTKVDGIISGLQNGHIVNYAGEFNNSTNYNLAQTVTYGGDWFVSNQNNNQGHTPSRTSSTYWVYISAPTVDLTPYLTIDNASATYATISAANDLDRRLLSAETTLQTNSTNIVNLNQVKADKSYVDNNFFNKDYINGRRVKYKDITITRVVKDINLINGELWLGQFETNFTFTDYNYLVNNIIFYDILFTGATYTNWKHRVTAAYSYTAGSTTRLGIKFLYTEQPTVNISQNQIIRIWYSEEINR